MNQLFKGTATSKETDEMGYLTAYLPEDNIFAVFFGEDSWHTYKESEEDFLNRFKIVIYEEV